MNEDVKYISTSRCSRRGSGIAVARGKNESIESLLSRFKKEIITHGVLDQYKESLSFVKPSIKNRIKRLRRKRNAQLSNKEE